MSLITASVSRRATSMRTTPTALWSTKRATRSRSDALGACPSAPRCTTSMITTTRQLTTFFTDVLLLMPRHLPLSLRRRIEPHPILHLSLARLTRFHSRSLHDYQVPFHAVREHLPRCDINRNGR